MNAFSMLLFVSLSPSLPGDSSEIVRAEISMSVVKMIHVSQTARDENEDSPSDLIRRQETEASKDTRRVASSKRKTRRPCRKRSRRSKSRCSSRCRD